MYLDPEAGKTFSFRIEIIKAKGFLYGREFMLDDRI